VARRAIDIPLVRILLAALILAAVSFGGTLLYLALRSPQAHAAPETTHQTPEPAAPRLLVPIDLTTIEMPNEAERLQQWSWKRFRPPRERWSAEDVDRFWIDTAQVGAEYLSETNRRLIRELLSEVP